MINLSSASYGEFSGSHRCDCGKQHKFDTLCLLKHGAFNELSNFLVNFTPLLSRVVIFYDNDELMNLVLCNIKRDYRVTSIKIGDSKKLIEQTELPEDTKLILAVGSAAAINSAKYKAYCVDLPVVVASLPEFSALTPYCVINDEGIYLSYKVSIPRGYVFDLDCEITDDEKATLFGMVAARLNTSFEYYAAALLGDGEYCPYLSGAMSDVAAKTILDCASLDKSAPTLKNLLIEQGLRLSLIAQNNIPRCGEIQCGLTYAALNSSEYSQGELQFIFASVLSMLYISHICRRKSFTPPPDNNYRLEQISELFGISETRAIGLIRPQLSGSQAAIIEYKIREYTPELHEKLNKNRNLFKLAFRTFKRMHADDGYSLRELVGGDISLCIALSPDVIQGEGMLTALKRLGELDCYII